MTTGRINQIAGVALGKARHVQVPLSLSSLTSPSAADNFQRKEIGKKEIETTKRRQVRRGVARPNMKRVTYLPLINSPSGSPSEH